jgi:ABC-type multidrug transport system fused ATPase/permease subunit
MQNQRDLNLFASQALALMQKKYKFKLVLILWMNIFLGVIDLIGVILVGVATSRVLTNQSTSGETVVSPSFAGEILGMGSLSTNQLSLIAMGLLSIKSLLGLFTSKYLLSTLSEASNIASKKLLQNYSKSDFTWIRKIDEQQLAFSFSEGINSLILGILGGLVLLLSELMMIAILVTGLFLLNKLATVFAIGFFGGFAYLLLKIIAPKVKKAADEITENSNSIRRAVLDSKNLFYETKFGNTEFFMERILLKRKASAHSYSRAEILQTLPKYLFEIFGTIGIFGGLFLMNREAMNSELTGMIGVFLAATSRLVPSLLRMQSNWLSLNRNVGYVTPARAIFNEIGENLDKPMEVPANDFKASPASQITRIELSNVSFSFPDSDRYTLKNVNCSFHSSKTYAIVGNSGAGKSTFINLLLGLYDPSAGDIKFWKGTDCTLKPLITYLPQDPYIFDGTLLENIALKSIITEVELAEIKDILIQINLWAIFRDNPNWHETKLGFEGKSLSGGERQRIVIARALFARSSVVILDEPTSSLDSSNEQLVTDIFLESDFKGIVIVVAHRYRTIKSVDEILYFTEGTIQAKGDWHTLMKLVPEFSQISKDQGLQ